MFQNHAGKTDFQFGCLYPAYSDIETTMGNSQSTTGTGTSICFNDFSSYLSTEIFLQDIFYILLTATFEKGYAINFNVATMLHSTGVTEK